MYIQNYSKETLGLVGAKKSGKSIPFDWTIDFRKSATKQSENKSQPSSEVVVSSPSPPIRNIDTRGLPLCKHCGKPILWGQVTEELGEKSKRGLNSWIPFDPDYSFHGCTK